MFLRLLPGLGGLEHLYIPDYVKFLKKNWVFKFSNMLCRFVWINIWKIKT